MAVTLSRLLDAAVVVVVAGVAGEVVAAALVPDQLVVMRYVCDVRTRHPLQCNCSRSCGCPTGVCCELVYCRTGRVMDLGDGSLARH